MWEARSNGDLAIVFPNGIEDIQSPDRLVECDDFVADISWDAVEIAGLESLLLAADDEDCAARQDHSYLLVRVGVFLDHGVRLQVGHG